MSKHEGRNSQYNHSCVCSNGASIQAIWAMLHYVGWTKHWNHCRQMCFTSSNSSIQDTVCCLINLPRCRYRDWPFRLYNRGLIRCCSLFAKRELLHSHPFFCHCVYHPSIFGPLLKKRIIFSLFNSPIIGWFWLFVYFWPNTTNIPIFSSELFSSSYFY